jgi:hypothetical protein
VWDEVRDLGYKEGLEKAWEAVKRIALSVKDNGLSMDECQELFGHNTLYAILNNNMSVYDVIEMLDKYDERNEIHVGDEIVFDDGEKAVVTKVYNELQRVTAVCSDGCARCRKIDDIKKTGNHFAEVSKMLETLREGETE